jgi:hypothetical protein
MRYFSHFVLVLAACCVGWAAFAQEDTPPPADDTAPAASTDAAATTTPPAPSPAKAKPAPVPEDPAALFDPAVAAVLQAQWETQEGHAGTPFTAPTSATILSQPSGFDVFMISVADVRAAEQAGTGVTVESLVFNDAHHVGQTPLTVSLAAQDYVLAVRSTKRAGGFDGDCVRQFTRDPITGGHRFDYHLYPFKKDRNNYICFVANFLAEGFPEAEALAVPESHGLYAVPQQALQAALAGACQAESKLQARLVDDLLKYGVAYYKLDGQAYLVKLMLNGTEPMVQEWPVAAEPKS